MIFFTNIGTKLANRISSPDSNNVSPLKSKNQQKSIFSPTNTDKMIKITKTVKASNSSGIDNISTKGGHHFLWNRGVMNFRKYLCNIFVTPLFDDQNFYDPPPELQC